MDCPVRRRQPGRPGAAVDYKAGRSGYHTVMDSSPKPERTRLTAEDWEVAALQLIAEQGVGALAVLCLAPLAATSTHGWMRRLGRGWKRLHALVYPAAILSVLHFDWMRAGKHDLLEPRLYALVLALLLAVRLPGWWRGRRAARRDVPG